MQGEFTAENAKTCMDALSEMFDALPKSKRLGYLGHLNEISLFLSAAEKAAPKPKAKKEK